MTEEKFEDRFVNATFEAVACDKATRAVLRRADSSTLGFQSCEYLLKHGIDIENPLERLSASVIAASIARTHFNTDGELSFSRALQLCYPDGRKSDAAVMKLRRVCSCSTPEELVMVLGPTLRLIDSRDVNVNRAHLFWQLRQFRFESQREKIRTRWMMEFFAKREDAA